MSTKKICFLGTHGQYNIGDELLLETFLSQLGSQHHYAINSYDPNFTRDQLGDDYNVEVFHTSEHKWRLLVHILRSDLLFFGGGSIVKELYASVGRNRYSTLGMILMIVTFAHWVARKPIVMSNIGVGPLPTWFGRILAKLILCQVDFVTVRDASSYQTCQQLKLHPNQFDFVPDAVFSRERAFFTPTSARVDHSVPPADPGRLKIALNLNYHIANPDNWSHFIRSLACSLRELHAQIPLEIHALPMQAGFKENDDLTILTDFRAEIPDIDFFVHQPATPKDVGQIIAACDIVVAERLHVLIIAAILHKPLFALIYDIKVRELVSLLQIDCFALDINQPFQPATLTADLLYLIDHRTMLIHHLQIHTTKLRTQLNHYFHTLNQKILAPFGSDTRSIAPVTGSILPYLRKEKSAS